MANRLACERADLVAAVAPVAGTLGVGVPCNPSRPGVRAAVIHGTADPVVPFDGGPMAGAAAERHRQRAGPGRPVARRRPPGPVDETNGAVGRSAASGCARRHRGWTSSASTVAVTSGWRRSTPPQASGQFFASHG